ncbi:MAG: NAD(P)-dependent oxidoreductase, partial [bacterium]|nr:NAD(P)-dependent oxidoreductase [bacterium]
MISKRVVIIGSDGQLGCDLMRVFGDRAIGLTHKDIEITDADMVFSVLSKLKPDVVINTAAIVKSEWCEINREACFKVNAYGAQNVAKASAAIGAVSVFISSDYVFDGHKQSFSESDIPVSLNVYGTSKLEGEQLTKTSNSRHYIIRTSWLFGVQVSHKGYDFPRLMLKVAREKGQVSVVNDQFGSPTYTYDLSLKIKQLVD